MNPWYLLLLLPAAFYAGFVVSNARWVLARKRSTTVRSPYSTGDASTAERAGD